MSDIRSMVKHTKRTAAEQRMWDALVIELAPKCFAYDIENAAQGCAHVVREIADAIVLERRQSIQEDRP